MNLMNLKSLRDPRSERAGNRPGNAARAQRNYFAAGAALIAANMWTVIHFQPLESGITSIRIVGMGFDDSEESRQMREFFAQGNAWTLEQLRKRFSPEGKPLKK